MRANSTDVTVAEKLTRNFNNKIKKHQSMHKYLPDKGKYILIHDLLFLPISTIESAVS